jgi:hypothetical protein
MGDVLVLFVFVTPAVAAFTPTAGERERPELRNNNQNFEHCNTAYKFNRQNNHQRFYAP